MPPGVAVGLGVGEDVGVGPGTGVCELGIGLAGGRLTELGTCTVGVANFCVPPISCEPVSGLPPLAAARVVPTPRPASATCAPVVTRPMQPQIVIRTSTPTTPDVMARYCGLVSQRCWNR